MFSTFDYMLECCFKTTKRGFYLRSGYRVQNYPWIFNLKPYLTISCNVTVMHEGNAVGFAET